MDMDNSVVIVVGIRGLNGNGKNTLKLILWEKNVFERMWQVLKIDNEDLARSPWRRISDQDKTSTKARRNTKTKNQENLSRIK